MEKSSSRERPALLQLNKWDTSTQRQLNLSEFREAFISPTRELLLLLSYESEALLIPLATGDSVDDEVSQTPYNENPQCSCTSTSSSQDMLISGWSHAKDSIPCHSEIDFGKPDSLDHNTLGYNKFAFVFGIKSVAWSACEDTYDQHKGLLFREFLFVSGSRGVSVHAFRDLNDLSKTSKCTADGEFRQGKWVDWGPSISNQNAEQEIPVDVLDDGTWKVDEASANFKNEGQRESHKDAGVAASIVDGSKRWMRSFFTDVVSAEYEGRTWLRFPERSSFPCSAKVVSFSILDGDQPLQNILCLVKSVRNNDSLPESIPDHVKNLHGFTGQRSGERSVDILYRCTRVFSSDSHSFLGFVLELSDSTTICATNGPEKSRGTDIIVLVAKLFSWGLQWVSIVKPGETNIGTLGGWKDFCFSDNLVACLNASGLIFLFDAISGKFVRHLDLVQTSGLHGSSTVQEAEISEADGSNGTDLGSICIRKSSSRGSSYTNRKIFRSFVFAPHTSQLAAVDECGVIYVIGVGDFVPHEYYGSELLLPHFRRSRFGTFFNWEAGGLDIGHERTYPKSSECLAVDSFLKRNVQVSESDIMRNDLAQKIQHYNSFGEAGSRDLWLNGFSGLSKIADHVEPHLMRKIFLPVEKFGQDDCICFSPMGIIQFTRKHTNSGVCGSKIVHFDLNTKLSIRDDGCLKSYRKSISGQGIEEVYTKESVGCCYQGSFYLVTQNGLSVFLPSSSSSATTKLLSVGSICYLQPVDRTAMSFEVNTFLERKKLEQVSSTWQVEILDRAVLFEGPDVADRVCLENGWDLKLSRLGRLQIALDYMNFDEINQSLEMLGDVVLAEEGILRLLFTAVRLLHKNGSDNEVSAVLRLLGLATRFATKMIHKYGLLEFGKYANMTEGLQGRMLSLPPVLPDENEIKNSRRLREMAHFLEIIRNWQYRLSTKYKKLGKGDGDNEAPLSLLDPSLQDDSCLKIVPADIALSEARGRNDVSLSASISDLDNSEKLALVTFGSFTSRTRSLPENSSDSSALLLQGQVLDKKVLPLENPKEMMARWKTDNLDLKNVVKDALLSGRLPLAVLQLHLQYSRDLDENEEQHDKFSEVRDIGRAIAYDLFLKGESALAIATLQRLGEDIELCLKQLLVGTLRRSLRAQITEEMRKYGYLGPYEGKILERMTLIERLYPSSHFQKTLLARQKDFQEVASPTVWMREIKFQLLDSCVHGNLMITCGEVDGVVLGSWTKINEHASDSVSDEAGSHAGYWAAAAVWSNAWDQKTFDRIVLDQLLGMGVHVPWESQLEYYTSHNNCDEVLKLLDLVPASVLINGRLQIALDCSDHSSYADCNHSVADRGDYIFSVKEMDAIFMNVPYIKILGVPGEISCSLWLKRLLEQELAKKMIFLKEHWKAIEDIICLLARAGLINDGYQVSVGEDTHWTSLDLCLPDSEKGCHVDTIHALHKIFLHYCVRYNLPNLLDLYIDIHKLTLDNESLGSLLEAADDCQWAKWLLLSRIKGREYDASFANARAIMFRTVSPRGELNLLGIDEVICTVDDIAEGGGEMAALATLMYAPAPIQKCLSSDGMTRLSSSSAQCTLENLRSVLQRFPTLWNSLVASCSGQTARSFIGTRSKNVLSEYLNWRDSVFFSAGHDTSLLQMLPYWFPKAVRRLVQLYIQGPLGWLSFSGYPTGEYFMHRDIDFLMNADDHTEISAISWEAIIQKHIQEELYHSSIEGTGLGLEHCLHRGRALAAFDHLLALRVEKLKLEMDSGALTHGQTNVQGDVQTLLAPLTQSEESLLSSVIPLAITHFEDSVLVASCAFLLELCGLSASMLRVDVASLRRISSFYETNEKGDIFQSTSPKGSVFHAVSSESDIMGSLARALAEEYVHRNFPSNSKESGAQVTFSGKQSHLPIMLVLHHLEIASLPQMMDGKTCGYWLLTGNGDGTEQRSQQKAASQHWNLVNVFCQMHQLSLSTKYLAVLARDNDWVGFLSEAQLGGYPFDKVIQVASKEFSDPRLKVHILTVLKAINSKKKTTLSYSDATGKTDRSSFPDIEVYVPAELFQILADSEKRKNPGEFLLLKAKDLSWSILAMIASCFFDVSPLSCLTVWLEITAARETSSIKVNDIASQIAENVAAAVEATNSLPANTRAVLVHYNRKSLKRRRLTAPESEDSLHSSNGLSASCARIISAHTTNDGEGGKGEGSNVTCDLSNMPASLSKMVAVLCEQQFFLPLLRAFELFLPSSSLLPFIRALQAFSQMRLSEASAHLGSFSVRIKDEPLQFQQNSGKEIQFGGSWITSTAVKAADAVLSTCPSPYEKRCLLQLLAATEFGDGGSAATRYRRLFWKIDLAEPSFQRENHIHLGNEADDGSLLLALENNRQWEQARNWAKQLETTGGPWKSAVHHVTETQAESMVAEWKEFLWDVAEERMALWGHCQTLFVRYSFPALKAGSFFLKHAEAVDKELPAREIHELLLLSLQWLSGVITQSHPVYPLHLLREIETRVWLLVVESEAQAKSGDLISSISSKGIVKGSSLNIIDRTASIISNMDNHINAMTKNGSFEKHDPKNGIPAHQRNQIVDNGSSTKAKRRAKAHLPPRRPPVDPLDKSADFEDSSLPSNTKSEFQVQDESTRLDISFSKWVGRVEPAELEMAVLSLMDFGQITAAKQLQHKLFPGNVPSEFVLVDVALKLASIPAPNNQVQLSTLDEEVTSVIQSYDIPINQHMIEPLQVLESLSKILNEGSGRGQARKIIAVLKAGNILGLPFAEAYEKQPVELLRLLSLKAQESFEEAWLLVQTHSMPAASIAQILAESFLKGLLAAHRGGYMDSQKEEGPAPLLWRFSDFLRWAKLCPSEPEIGHALMRLVITGQEIPHACEVELLILSHHFYKSSACLDGVDVLVALAATRVDAYVSEGDFSCMARLITGVGNFHALNFILGILIENGQLDLLLQKYSAAANTNTSTAQAVRSFRMAVLTALRHFNPDDLDAFAMVYNHFDMKHETAGLLESRAEQAAHEWLLRQDKDQNEDLLDSMRFYIEAAEVHSSIDAGNKTRKACAQASLVSLQIRMPDSQWLNLSDTNARRELVEQSQFQEALVVAEAYGLNQPSEWALVLWNHMLKPELIQEYVAEFVAVLPLQPSMLMELAKFYRAEVAARGDQSQFSVWLTGGGLPADWLKYLGKSFRCLLKRTRDVRLRLQLATIATGFRDVFDVCVKVLDKVPDNAGPLVLRKGHGGAYLPLM